MCLEEKLDVILPGWGVIKKLWGEVCLWGPGIREKYENPFPKFVALSAA